MKQIFLLLFFTQFIPQLYAQANKHYEFVGTLQLENNELLTYKINFTTQPNNEFTGTSLTDIYGKDRTQSTINGYYNAKTKRLSFTESSNLSTKSTAKDDEFCYITVKDAKFRNIGNKTILQGQFIGKFKSGKTCATGNVYLISSEYIEQFTESYLAKQNPDSAQAIRKKISTLKEIAEKNTLSANDVFSLNWKSKDIIIEIWDGEQEDSDEIGLIVNNKKILDKLIIKKEKKVIVVPFDEELNTIKIIGISEGQSGKCTANILLRDGLSLTPIITSLKKGESTTITLKK